MTDAASGAASASLPPDRGVSANTRDRVSRALRDQLLVGRFQPGRPVTLRGLADDLGVSPMPVREAIRGLVAEKALDISASGRISVPKLDQERIADILKARQLLEPAAAAMALPQLDRESLRQIKSIDDAIDASLADGDVEGYMRLNHAFHFALYRQSRSDVFLPLIESVWLRFAPFMRMVYGRVGTTGLVDHHKTALEAAGRGDGAGLAEAIRLDISEGMSLIGAALRDTADDGGVPRRKRRAIRSAV